MITRTDIEKQIEYIRQSAEFEPAYKAHVLKLYRIILKRMDALTTPVSSH